MCLFDLRPYKMYVVMSLVVNIQEVIRLSIILIFVFRSLLYLCNKWHYKIWKHTINKWSISEKIDRIYWWPFYMDVTVVTIVCLGLFYRFGRIEYIHFVRFQNACVRFGRFDRKYQQSIKEKKRQNHFWMIFTMTTCLTKIKT